MTESQVESITAAAAAEAAGSECRRQRAEGESQGTSLASFAAQVNHNNIKFDFSGRGASRQRRSCRNLR